MSDGKVKGRGPLGIGERRMDASARESSVCYVHIWVGKERWLIVYAGIRLVIFFFFLKEKEVGESGDAQKRMW